MLTQVVVSSPVGSFSDLELNVGDSSDPIQIRNITGLGPVNATISSTQFGNIDGEFYTGSARGKRNIVFTLGLNPNWVDQSMESLRQQLYTYFMTKRLVKLTFVNTHLPETEIYGYVETFEPNIFSKDPEVQVSILCPSPDFVATTVTTVTGLVDDGTDPTDITYSGTSPTGFVLKVEPSVANPSFSGAIAVLITMDEILSLMFTATVSSAMYAEVSTVQGDKYVHKITTPGGLVTSLLNTVIGAGDWPYLQPGVNPLAVVSAEADQTWTLTYYNRYGGL